MLKEVDYGFCGLRKELAFVGDVVKNRFSLNNPYVVLKIYKCGSSWYFYLGKIGGNGKNIWLCNNDVEYVCRGYEYHPVLVS